MSPLNPFLRAFFRSSLPSQCSPVQVHVLLVPTTDVLLNSQDSDTNALFVDLAGSDEFLASHTIRIPAASLAGPLFSDRDVRTQTRQYSTLNGRVVVIKDSTVYATKGFKRPTQAQLLNDSLYYPDQLDTPGWLIYYISRPLTGTLVPISTVPALLADPNAGGTAADGQDGTSTPTVASKSEPAKTDIKSFGALLYQFPPIAKQMQPGLDRLLTDLSDKFEGERTSMDETESARRDRTGSTSGHDRARSVSSSGSGRTSGSGQPCPFIELHEHEKAMRDSLETAVTAAVDLFQRVDRSKLVALNRTELTGAAVERLIERYVVEHVDTVLYPRICVGWKASDADLDRHIRQIRDIDVGQVGLAGEGGRTAKRELSTRLGRGVAEFAKLGRSASPQEMLDALVKTLVIITSSSGDSAASSTVAEKGDWDGQDVLIEQDDQESLGRNEMLTVDADTLVSLLLVVVIRSRVRQLQARFIYMRFFIFSDDVDRGEAGYALSTFEAVLSYLKTNANGLIRLSHRNRRLWEAVRAGDVAAVKAMLRLDGIEDVDETDGMDEHDDDEDEDDNDDAPDDGDKKDEKEDGDDDGNESENEEETIPPTGIRRGILRERTRVKNVDTEPGQSVHVGVSSLRCPVDTDEPIAKKRVTMDTRSVSVSSFRSMSSRANTVDSVVENGSSTTATADLLAQTENRRGESVVMMAIVGRRSSMFEFLFGLRSHFSTEFVLYDRTSESTTLLSAAVQSGQAGIAGLIIDFLLTTVTDEAEVQRYIAVADSNGRSVGHYLFHQPNLIGRIGHLIPWTQKDRLGQTALLSLCRSYDHADYRAMIEAAVAAATASQGNGLPLNVDAHVDGRGNSLLHVVNDPHLAVRLLRHCDVDPNLPNERQLTPLMMASKYGRADLVRPLFRDARVDVFARDVRGLSAIELAKNDDVRNRIDDLVLLSAPAGDDGRTTAVVRSFVADEGAVFLVVKSAVPVGASAWTVATSARAMSEFEQLAGWLAREQPASWLPDRGLFTSPFLVPSRPSRAVLRDIQVRLDRFLFSLLNHPTFATHEMVWEFFLAPEMSAAQFEHRSVSKAASRAEMVQDEFGPVVQTGSVELFVDHAQETVRSLHGRSRVVVQRVNAVRMGQTDLADAIANLAGRIHELGFVPARVLAGWDKFVAASRPGEWTPLTGFFYNFDAAVANMTGILAALKRPERLIRDIETARKAEEKHLLAARRSEKWPSLGILDGARLHKDALEKATAAQLEQARLGRELGYAQHVIAGELAGWQDQRLRLIRRALRDLTVRTLSVEKARLERLVRASRTAGVQIETGLIWAEQGGNVNGGSSAGGVSVPLFRERKPGDPV